MKLLALFTLLVSWLASSPGDARVEELAFDAPWGEELPEIPQEGLEEGREEEGRAALIALASKIDLPEGESNAVSLTDELASGSVSYFLADNADYDVTYEFAGISSINGQAPSAAAFNAVPADGANGTATWDIGAVVTETEDDSTVNDVMPYIRAIYSARINNDLVTDVGDTLQNSATAYYTNGDTGAQDSINDATAPITAMDTHY